jgi:hypothetical protein
MNEKQALEISIEEMNLGEAFCETSRKMGFKKLKDILFILPEELIAKSGFTYTWLGELSVYLDKNGLLYLLQPLPGRNRV